MLEHTISAFANLLRTEAENDRQKFAVLPTHFKSIATKVETIKADYETKQKDEKSRFNVFDTLTRHHLEELHSNFIAYLLNIDEKHDFGDTFLRFFVEIVNENLDIDDKINDFDYKNAKIHKEHSTKYGRLDIFITTMHFNIIIENKIYANEQDEQIPRYVAFAKSQHKPYIVLYLTPEGDDSATGAADTYHAISYRNDILKWLERCLLHIKNYPIAHAGIYFYKKTLEQKILHITDNQILMNIKKLFEDENPDALALLGHWDEIELAMKSYGNDLRAKFLKKVKNKLNENTEKYNFFHANKVWKKIYNESEIYGEEKGLTTEKYKLNDSTFAIQFYNSSWGLFYGVISLKKQERDDLRQKYLILAGLEPDGGGLWSLKRFIYKGENFASTKMTHFLATEMEEIVTQFVTEVEDFLSSWRETVEELNKKQ
jgi:hypothetical protein